jgi:tetratricopeptide (TPR) repeat protein
MTLAEADFERPLSYFQHALMLRETAQDQRGICESLFHIGLIAERKRHYDDALRALNTVYTTAKHHHYQDTVAEAARHLGFAHLRAGAFDQALDCFQEARHLLEETRQNIFLPFAELSVGEVFSMQQQWEQAEHHYQLAYALAQAMQIKRASVQIAYSLGEVCEAQNNAAQAYTYYETAYDLATAIHFTPGITMCSTKLQGRPH